MLPSGLLSVERFPLALRVVIPGFVCALALHFSAVSPERAADLLGVAIVGVAIASVALTLRLTTIIDPSRRVVRKAWGLVVPFVVAAEAPFSAIFDVRLRYDFDGSERGGTHGYSAVVRVGAVRFRLARRTTYDRARSLAVRAAETIGCDLSEPAGVGRFDRSRRPNRALPERLRETGVGARPDEALARGVEHEVDGGDVVLTIHQNAAPSRPGSAVLGMIALAVAIGLYPATHGGLMFALLFGAVIAVLLRTELPSALQLSFGRWRLRAGPWGVRITRSWLADSTWELPASAIEAIFISQDERQLRGFPVWGVRVVGAGRSVTVATGLAREHLHGIEHALKAALVSDRASAERCVQGRPAVP